MIALQEQIDRSSRFHLPPSCDARWRDQRGGTAPPTGRHSSGLATHLAHDLVEYEAALRLVYDAYLETDLIAPNPYEMRVTKYHPLPTSHLFVACEQDELVGTLTLVRDTPRDGLPMQDVFHEEIRERRARGISMAEVSCLADAGYGKSSMLSVVVQLMSHMAQFALRHGVQELVIAVHPHHVGFYERFAAFEVIGHQRSYGAVLDNPAVALAVDLTTVHIKNPRVHKRFFGNPFPEVELTPQPLDRRVLQYLNEVLARTSDLPCRNRQPLPQAA